MMTGSLLNTPAILLTNPENNLRSRFGFFSFRILISVVCETAGDVWADVTIG